MEIVATMYVNEEIKGQPTPRRRSLRISGFSLTKNTVLLTVDDFDGIVLNVVDLLHAIKAVTQ